MKKFLLSVIGLFLMTSATFAQQSKKSDSSCSKLYDKSYVHVSLGLSPVTFKTTIFGEDFDELGPLDMTGISWGFTTGIRMMKTQPLYLEVGAKFLNAFRTEKEYEGDKGKKSFEMKNRLFSLNVPIVATWQVEVVPKVCIAPYLGLNMRYNFTGRTEETLEYDYYGKPYKRETIKWFKDSEGNCNRFNVGVAFGANFTFNRFVIGLGYTKDLTEFMQSTLIGAKMEYFTISGGLRF